MREMNDSFQREEPEQLCTTLCLSIPCQVFHCQCLFPASPHRTPSKWHSVSHTWVYLSSSWQLHSVKRFIFPQNRTEHKDEGLQMKGMGNTGLLRWLLWSRWRCLGVKFNPLTSPCEKAWGWAFKSCKDTTSCPNENVRCENRLRKFCNYDIKVKLPLPKEK